MNSTVVTTSPEIKSPFIVAFDCADLTAASHLADQLSPQLCRAKVGKELFTACGMAVIDMLHSKGYEVFLDLKYHDIPTTVAKAVAVVANAGIWMVNVHASGGHRMMSAAIEAATQSNKTHLIAVTVLTSMTDEDLQLTGVTRSVEEQVMFLADSAKNAGLNGVVCSAQEAQQLRARCGKDFLLVTPGIRPANAVADDQRRTLTPREAIDAGSDYLVVGRPITQADDPLQALQEMLASLD